MLNSRNVAVRRSPAAAAAVGDNHMLAHIPSRRIDASSLVEVVASFRPHRHPRIAAMLLMWLVGLYSMFLARPPVAMSPEQQARVNILWQQFEEEQAGIQTLLQQEELALKRLREAKSSWFWWTNTSQRAAVGARTAEWRMVEAALQQHSASEAALLGRVRREAGLWSEMGVKETRQFFWDCFNRGKLFSKRQTLYDALYQLATHRERLSVGMLLELLCTTVINFTTGMLFALFIFVWQLPGYVAAYVPGLVSGVLFSLIALLSALSVVGTFLLVLYGGGAAAAYGLTTLTPLTPPRDDPLEWQQHVPPRPMLYTAHMHHT